MSFLHIAYNVIKLQELILLEEILIVFQNNLSERGVKTVERAAMLAEDYELAYKIYFVNEDLILHPINNQNEGREW